ncbi:hypothetical protein ACSFE6_12535 [Pseudomonas baetica]|uniref:hypothetical protein n=1 Tax=Pseudomonas baetica TaxID=674054 RepID=UPI003EEAA6F8
MRKKSQGYLAESKLIIRQGEQLWHLHQALKERSEREVVMEMAQGYLDAGRTPTFSDGLMIAGGVVNAYRSTEAGERVIQKARTRLKTRNDEIGIPAALT